MKKILNFGSMNVDYVYTTDHIVRGGETTASYYMEIFAGGKGLNQSIALSRAGLSVYHAGLIGDDGDLLLETLKENKVDTFILFGGTNDSWANSPIGKPIESGSTKEDLYSALPAFSYLIHLMKTNLTDTKMYFILNSDLKEELTDFYKYICKKNDITLL